ncbi:hypothetical protein F5Y17DRAFT_251150 [Xylariaceae sp. FL0594]|nr:hypothetical protein F5Y17DRAFT_251150 [Xylariaceae sp. FL0594]
MGDSTSRKRKLEDDEGEDVKSEAKKPRKSPKKQVEKRLRRFRSSAPAAFSVIYQRATEQRFYVIERTRCGTVECPEEYINITGSTGNVYKVHIAELPSCDCPHARKGNQCKHVVYVLSRVLRARFDLVYQLALVPSELREIFENAPAPEQDGGGGGGKDKDRNRKEIEGDCPICFSPFESAEDTVYCRATCGQNMHTECFEMWAATGRKSARDTVTCPMCRSPWQGDEDMVKKIKKKGKIGPDGYVNVADQLGISGVRDRSTYYHGFGNGGYYGNLTRGYRFSIRR